MVNLQVGHIVINAVNPQLLAEFYQKLLGGKTVDYGNGYIGLDRSPIFPALLFQQADAPAAHPGWVHLDLVPPEEAQNEAGLAAIKEIITQAGGRLVEERGDSNFRWIVFEDIEHNPFCIPIS